jgi:hypothetical protein
MRPAPLAILLILGLGVPVFGGELRLGDVFTTSTLASRPRRVTDLTPESAKLFATALQADADAENWAAVMEGTELLSAYLAPNSTEFGDVLLLRGKAFQARGEREKLLATARLYIDTFPKGPHRGWFVVRLAQQALRLQRLPEAVAAWRLALAEGVALTEPEALDAAAALSAVGDGVRARAALDLAFAPGAVPRSARDRFMLLMLESLLLEDDTNRDPQPFIDAVVSGSSPAVDLRLGLWLETRQRQVEAKGYYRRAGEFSQKLTEQERTVLSQRLANSGQPNWPPREATP